MGRRLRLVLAASVAAITGLGVLAGCGDSSQPQSSPSSSAATPAGLLRPADLNNLRPTETRDGEVVDAAQSWDCAGKEDQQVLGDAGWKATSRTYSSPREHWALSTTVWRNEDGDPAKALSSLRQAVRSCSDGDADVREDHYGDGLFAYVSNDRSGDLEGSRGYTVAGDHVVAQVTLVGLDGHEPPPEFGAVLENSTRRAETLS